ncbi:MAG: hypothetical protein ABF242_03455 [Flavobacteriales bacterium]
MTKKFNLILILSFFILCACKKDRLNDDLSIFEGEWLLITKINTDFRNSFCQSDTIEIDNCATKLTIKKNRRAILTSSSGENKYDITYDDKATSGFWWTDRKSINYGCQPSDTTVSKFSQTELNFYLKSEELALNPNFYINGNEMIIYSDSEIYKSGTRDLRVFGSYSGNGDGYYTFWKKL